MMCLHEHTRPSAKRWTDCRMAIAFLLELYLKLVARPSFSAWPLEPCHPVTMGPKRGR